MSAAALRHEARQLAVPHSVEHEVDDPRDTPERLRIQYLERGMGRNPAQGADDGREQVHDGASPVVGEVESSGRSQAVKDRGAAFKGLLQA